MKRWGVLGLGLVIVAGAAGILLTRKPETEIKPLRSSQMKLSSSAFVENGAVPARYTCTGENINPPLTISEVPGEAKSLALVVDDPDAPGGTYDHWVLWNLPTSVAEIPEHWTPEPGVTVGKNGWGKTEYGGPCPPSGTHHYHFKLYALDRMTGLEQGSGKDDLEKAMGGHVLAQTVLVGTYAKP